MTISCILKECFTCFFPRHRALKYTPYSPSSLPTLLLSFASPSPTCDPYLSVAHPTRRQCGRSLWLWSLQNWNWSTKRPLTSRVSRITQDSQWLPASPSFWRPPLQTCTVGTLVLKRNLSALVLWAASLLSWSVDCFATSLKASWSNIPC